MKNSESLMKNIRPLKTVSSELSIICFTRSARVSKKDLDILQILISPATVPQNIDFCCSRSQSWKPSGRLSGELPWISGVHHGERARETSGDC
jgi:hypothetical protein